MRSTRTTPAKVATPRRMPRPPLPSGHSAASAAPPVGPSQRWLPLAAAAAVAVPWALTQHGSQPHAAGSFAAAPQARPTATPRPSPTPTVKPGSITYHPLGAPNIGLEEARRRLLPAVTGPAGTGGYRFFRDSDQQVARWDPCRPIHYVVNPAYAPGGGAQAIVDAVNTVSQASGLTFVYDGVTNERPSTDRQKYQEDKYGDRWAPVLITWSSPYEEPELADNVDGYGGGDEYQATDSKTPALVSGFVTLDALQLQADAPYLPAGAIAHLIEHELGHVLGLAHVLDATQLMAPEGALDHGPAAGDLRGFAQAGTGSCHPEM